MKIEEFQDKYAPLLVPFGYAYGQFMRLRRFAWNTGLFGSVFAPPRPVVSVGNIAWGGTGKSPMVSWLLDWCRECDFSATVLTRGYGGKAKTHPLVVTPHTSVEECGDEPMMLALKHPEARIVVDPKRARAGFIEEETNPPDLYILDDGMQHVAVQRNVDIVLLRPQDLGEQWDRVLPAGQWREGPSALRKASALLMKISEEEFAQKQQQFSRRLKNVFAPLFTFSLEPTALAPVSTVDPQKRSRTHPPLDIFSNEYILLSGIGNPADFAETSAIFMGKAAAAHLTFPDHHAYTGRDIVDCMECSAQHGNASIICTEKDAVKLTALLGHAQLPEMYGARGNFWALQTAVKFGPVLHTHKTFPQWWDSKIEGVFSLFESDS